MQRIDQAVDGGAGVLVGNFGELRVQGGGGRVAVAQQDLDMTKAQAAFKQMGGKAVTQ